MFVKVHKGKDSNTYPCAHVQVLHMLDGEGIQIELSPGGRTITLPDDGDTVYMMNDKGDTIDKYKWPPDVNRKEFRA